MKMQADVYIFCMRCNAEKKVRAEICYDHFEILDKNIPKGWVRHGIDVWCEDCEKKYKKEGQG